jgi:hypothetical protein
LGLQVSFPKNQILRFGGVGGGLPKLIAEIHIPIFQDLGWNFRVQT